MLAGVTGGAGRVNRADVRWFLKDTGSPRKFKDGEDDSRDLYMLGVKDGRDRFDLVIKVKGLKEDLRDTAYYALLDLNPSDGRFELPDGIRVATDHPWDLAIKLDPSSKKLVKVIWGMTLPPGMVGLNKPEDLIAGVKLDKEKGQISIGFNKSLIKALLGGKDFYAQVVSVYKPTKEVADSFNYPKPWENSNFLIGAFPVSRFVNLKGVK